MDACTLLVWERIIGAMEIHNNVTAGYHGRRSTDDFGTLATLMEVSREMKEVVVARFCDENVWTRRLSFLHAYSEGWLQSCRQWALQDALLLPVKILQTVPFHRDTSISYMRGNHYPVLESVRALLNSTGGIRGLLRRIEAKRKRDLAKAARPPKPRKRVPRAARPPKPRKRALH